MPDPISRAEAQRVELHQELAQAAEQLAGWADERNRLVMELAAVGETNVAIGESAQLSDVGVAKVIKRERAALGV